MIEKIELVQNEAINYYIQVLDSTGTAVSLSGYTAKAAFATSATADTTTQIACVISDAANGILYVPFTAAHTANEIAAGIIEVAIFDASGKKQTLTSRDYRRPTPFTVAKAHIST